jgi:hypothetical protein
MNAPIQPDPVVVAPPPIPGYGPAPLVHISDSPNATVNLGQGASIQQLTWPERLISKHSKLYWCVHFLIGLAAVIAWEVVCWLYHILHGSN